MSAIAKAIGPLVNIAFLLLFAIIIFAIIGLEFYARVLNKTCYDIKDLSKFWQHILNVSFPYFDTDVILTEVETGMPCTEGAEERAPLGAYTCR